MHKVETKSGFKNVIPCINTTARARVLTGFFFWGHRVRVYTESDGQFCCTQEKRGPAGKGGGNDDATHCEFGYAIKIFVYRYRSLDLFVYACHGSAQRGTQFFLNITDIPPEWICEHMSFSH